MSQSPRIISPSRLSHLLFSCSRALTRLTRQRGSFPVHLLSGLMMLLGVSAIAGAQTASVGQGWILQSPPTSPSLRYGPVSAYHAPTGNVVMFGGFNGSDLAETWLYTGTTWVQQTLPTSPAARQSALMTANTSTGNLVLFGGSHFGVYSAETWVYNGTSWTKQTPATSPPGRAIGSMTYDAATGNIVMFGGYNGVTYLSDTWVYDGTTWTQQTFATTPPARYGQTLAYDPAIGKVVMFGGYNGTYLGDTWTYDSTGWTKQSPATSPAPRYDHSSVYDPATGTVLLFGGQSSGYFNDTWTYNGTNWVLPPVAASPVNRSQASLAYDSAIGMAVLFGGLNGSYPVDTTTYSAASFTAPTTPVATAAAQTAVYFTIGTAGTLPALSNANVLTTGIVGLDYTLGTGSTCSGAVTAGQTCTVNVAFTPSALGLRKGSVNLKNSAGTILATGFVSGTGTAAQALYQPGQLGTTFSTALTGARGLSMDAGGNLYLTQAAEVDKIAAGSTIITALATGQAGVNATVVDAAGNVYFTSQSQNALFELVRGTGTPVNVASLTSPQPNLSVDGAGNVFGTLSDGTIYEVTAGAHTVIALVTGNGSHNFVGMGIDSAGNLYPADYTTNMLYRLPVQASSLTTLVNGGALSNPTGVTVDAAGNIYVANDGGSQPLLRYAAGTYALSTLSNVIGQYSPVIDATGTLFEITNTTLKSYTRTSAGLTFPFTSVGNTSPSQTVTLENDGNAPLSLSVPASGVNPAVTSPYVLGNGGTCPQISSIGTVQTLAAGATCTDVISFQPTTASATNPGTLTTSDTSNNAPSTQAVSLSGQSMQIAQTITFPQPATPAAAGSTVTLTATASSGLPVTYSITSGPATISGSSVTYTGVGTVVIAANQAGNAGYTAAPTVSDTVTTTAAPTTYTAPSGPVATTSATQQATFTFTSTVTLNATLSTAIQVLTLGAPNLDFKYVSGGTCTAGATYTSGQICTVQYSFTPITPGQRFGAVLLRDAAGMAVLTDLVSGIGTGPLAAISAPIQSDYVTGLSSGKGIAFDGFGNLYVTDESTKTLAKYAAGTKTRTVVVSGIGDPSGVVVDGAGNIFYGDTTGNEIYELVGGTGTPVPYAAISSPEAGMSFDNAGNLYVASLTANQVIKIAAGTKQLTGFGKNLQQVFGGTVDSAGNVYITDSTLNQIVMVTPDGLTQTVIASLPRPVQVILDPAGNLYVPQFFGINTVTRLAAGTYAQTVIGTGYNSPIDLRFDAQGNLFVSNVSKVIALARTTSIPLTFASTGVGQTSATQTLTLENDGNAALAISSITPSNSNFTFSGATVGSKAACGTTLASAGVCGLSAAFTPQTTGALSSTGTVADNSLYAVSQQTVALSGTSTLNAQTITFAQPTTPAVGGAMATLSATSTSGLAVTFSITSGPATLSGTNNSQITYTGTGAVVIAANQAGNAQYSAAPTVSRTVQVQSQPIITWNPSSHTGYNGVPVGAGVLDATSSTPGTFAYTATLSGGSPVAITAASTLAVGSYTLTANFTPTDTTNNTSATATILFTVITQTVFVANGNGSVTSTYDNGTIQSSAVAGGGIGAAVDASGSVWSINTNGNAISKFTDTGAFSVSYTGGGTAAASSIAIDGLGRVYVTNGNGTVNALTNAGGMLYNNAVAKAAAISTPTSVSVDSAGSLWIASSGDNSAVEIIGVAAPVVTPTVNAVKNANPGTRP